MVHYHGIAILEAGDEFPDPRMGPQDDPIAVGLELSPGLMLAGYRKGLFAWSVNPVTWWSPDPRAILPLSKFHVSKRLARKIKTRPFHVTVDGGFVDVVEQCAPPRSAENGVWITPEFVRAFLGLYHQGYAHSVECWRHERLVGGVFGVAINGFFSAESMFHAETDASKIALFYLIELLKASGFQLLDIQMLTAHTRSLGALELSRSRYLSFLERALHAKALPLRARTLVKPNRI
jgi:leucyl/phenylalanyl-tRNA--protein transferase